MDYSWFLLLIDALAVYRLTRLVTKDTLFQEARWWILRRWPSEITTFPPGVVLSDVAGDHQTIGHLFDSGREVFLAEGDNEPEWVATKTYKWTELLECPFCASVWIAGAVVAMRVYWDWWQYPALALALAGLVSLVFLLADKD